MKILFLTKLSRDFEYYTGQDRRHELVPELPITQIHHSYVKALRRQGHDVEVIPYTSSYLVDNFRRVILREKLRNVSDLGYRGLKKIKQYIPRPIDPGIWRVNNHIKRRVDQFEPDCVIVVGSYNRLLPSTFEYISNDTSSIIIALNGVGPFDFGTAIERYIAPKYYDLMLTTELSSTLAWRGLGVPTKILPTSAADSDLFDVNDKRTNYDVDVSFIGRPYPRRIQYLSSLTIHDLAIYGPGWGSTPLADFSQGPVWGREYVNVLKGSKISINIHHRAFLKGGNLKLFEIPAAGTLQIADAAGENWFDSNEIVLFNDEEDLNSKVVKYLEDETGRKQIADAGYRRQRREHTFEHRVEKLLEIIRALKAGKSVTHSVVDQEYLNKFNNL